MRHLQAVEPERIIRECPSCGCDWDVLRGCLRSLPVKEYSPFTGKLIGELESEEYCLAKHIISNCPRCKAEFPGVV